jgi:hypothetical protein
MSNYLTTTNAEASYQPIGTYLTSSSLNGYVTTGTTLLTKYLTTTNAAANYQPIGTYLTSSSLNGYVTTGTTLLTNYFTKTNLGSNLTTQSINVGSGGALQIYDVGTIDLQAGTITSTNGMIQHSTELDFIISSNYSSPPSSANILQLTSSNAKINTTLTCTGAATFNDIINVLGTINGTNAVLSSNLTSYASPSGTSGITSYGLYTKNPNSIHSNSSASLGFYTDTVNGSNAALFLTGTNNTGANGRTGQIYMQQPTGLIFSVPTGVGYRFYIASAIPFSIDSNSNIFFNGSTSPKLCIGGTNTSNNLEVNSNTTNCTAKFYASSGDCSLLLQSSVSGTTPGRFQIKCNAGGTVTIYANSGNSTGVSMVFMVSNSITCVTMNANGTATCGFTWTGPAFTSTSDSIFKDDQQPVSIDDCLQVFNNLTTKTFIRNDIPDNLANGIRSVGFVAQDLKNNLPSSFSNVVYENENYQGSDKTILSIDYGLLTSILWEIVRWQGTHIENLEDRLSAIENKLSKMDI